MCDTNDSCGDSCEQSWSNSGTCYADIVAGSKCGKFSNNTNHCNKYCDPNVKIDNCDGIFTSINPKVSIQEDKTFRLWGDGIINKGPNDSCVESTLDFSSLGKCFPLNRHKVKCVDGLINTAPAAVTAFEWAYQNYEDTNTGDDIVPLQFNTAGFDQLSVICTDTAGKNVYVAYQTNADTLNEIIVFKLDGATGTMLLWSGGIKNLVTDFSLPHGTGPSICTNGSEVFVSYTADAVNPIPSYIVVVQLDAIDGTLNWSKTISATGGDSVQSSSAICTNTCGNYGSYVYLTFSTNGKTTDPNTGLNTQTNTAGDIVVVKLDPTNLGQLVWVKQNNTFNKISSVGNTVPVICVDELDELFVAYQTVVAPVTTNTIVVFKMNRFGVEQWITSDNDITFNAISPTTVGNDAPAISVNREGMILYLSYYTDGNLTGSTKTGVDDIVVARFNGTTGSIMWAVQNSNFNAGSSAHNTNPSICTDDFGKYVIGTFQTDGEIGGTNLGLGSFDVIVFIMDKLGNVLWIQENANINSLLLNMSARSDQYPKICCDASGSQIYGTDTTSGLIPNSAAPFGEPDTGEDDIVVWNFNRNFTGGSGIISLQSTCPNIFDVIATVPFTTDQIASDPDANIVPFSFLINGMIEK